jgi:PAS domain S-box-containing protein
VSSRILFILLHPPDGKEIIMTSDSLGPVRPLVLVIDDEVNMRLLTRGALEPAGFDVQEAEDGIQALKAFKDHRPDIVLLDVVMPSMDGYAVCSAIRRVTDGDRVPIVMLTALDDIESIKRAYEVGATDFITKPINWVILSHRVRYMVRNSQLAERLRKSERKIRAILDAIPDLMIRISKDGVLLEAKGAKDMELLLPQEEYSGKTLAQVLPADVAELTMKNIRQVLETSTTRIFEYEIDVKTIPSFYEANMVASGEDEVLCIVRDITRRRKMEEELLKAKKTEAIGILAGGIAHDFNNLLAIILGNVTMAQTEVLPNSSCYKLLADAEQAALRSRDLTKQFITLSSGGAPIKKPASLKRLIVESVSQVWINSDIPCEYEFSDDLWEVEVDSTQMKHVVQNLVTNAREAMPPGGRIRISAANTEVASRNQPEYLEMKEGKYVRISIKDEGIGIPRHNLDKIFDPYFSTKERGCQKGMGLGLAVVYSVLKKHGGYIFVESELAVGTTFNIYLPAMSGGSPARE